MTTYSIYNCVVGVILIAGSLWLNSEDRWRRAALAARVGLVVAAFGYPWDFFAIHLKSWRYPIDPGTLIHGVPVNDLVLMWICTYFTSALMIWAEARYGRREGHAEGKYKGQHNAGQDR